MAYEDDDDEEVIARAEEESAPPQGITPWQPPAAEEDTSIPEAARYTAGVAPWNPPQQAQPPAGITPWNPPTEERQPPAGIKPWQPPQEQRPEAEGAIGTAAREAAGATPATLGSLAGGAATAGVGRVLGGIAGRAIGGTLGTFLGPAGTVGGWLGGGFVGGYIGDELARGIKSFLGFDDDAQRAANREANPMAAAAGQAAPLLLGLSPGRGIQAGARLLSGAIGGVTEGATQVATGDYSKEQLAANIIGGILLPGNKRWLSNIEERAAARAGGTRPAAATEQPVTVEQPAAARTTAVGEQYEPSTYQPQQYEPSVYRPRETPGVAPAKPSTAVGEQYEPYQPQQYEPSVYQPHGTPGSKGSAGTAEAQAPPPAAKAHGPEDWGKKPVPAEGAATGVNVADVDPTLAHAIQAKAPAQQAGIMQDLGPRVQAILDGPSAEAAGKFREIGEAYRKVGQNGQAAKYDIVAKELDRQHALQPSEPAPATVAAARPAEVLRGPEPAATAPTVGDQLKAKQAEKVAAAAKPPLKGGYQDTRGRGVQFHGAPNEVTLTEGNYGASDAYYGTHSLYTTDALDAAHGYANKRKATAPSVYEVQPPRNAKIYDMEKPITPEVRAQIDEIANSRYGDAAGIAESALSENPKNLREFFDHTREYASGERVPADEIQESVFHPIMDYLSGQGYHGMSHRGGLRTKTPEHNVTIYFEPEKNVRLRKMEEGELAGLRSPTVGDQLKAKQTEKVAAQQQQQQQQQQPAAPIRPNTVRTHDGAVFTGATTNEAAARAAAAGYRPGQIFRAREAAAAPGGQPPRPPPGGAPPRPPPPPLGTAGGVPPRSSIPPTAAPRRFEGVRAAGEKIMRRWQETFQPETVTPGALRAEPLFRGMKSARSGERDRIFHAAQEGERRWNNTPEDARYSFLSDVENGRTVKPEQQADATRLRHMLNEANQLEKEAGLKAYYRENYFPHEFKQKAGQQPLAEHFTQTLGPNWFQKGRTIDLIEQARAAGYELKNSNPYAAVRSRLMAGADLRMQKRLLDDLRTMGMAGHSEEGTNARLQRMGYQAINGPDGKQWMLSPEIQPLWKNAISGKSLWSNPNLAGDVFKGWMQFKAFWVPIKLALSGFHVLHVAHINFSSNIARALDQAIAGDASGAMKSMGQALMTTFRPEATVGGKAISAKEAQAQWLLGENARSPEGKLAIQYMEEGGFVPHMSEQLRSDAMQRLDDAWKAKNPFGLAYHGPRELVRRVQAPIFEAWIPRVKTSAYLNDVAALLERRPELHDDPQARKMAMSAIAKSIDNRFGEMFYDGLFWNRMTKDLSIGSMLSLGWNLGFAREFGGAAVEAVTRPAGKFIPGMAPSAERAIIRDATNKIKFASVYMGTALMIGGMMTKAFTGENPDSMNDYIFPRISGTNPDGSPRRLTTMFYTREIPMLGKHIEEHGGGIGGTLAGATAMLWNKTLFQPFLELYQNRSYFGSEIWNPHSPGYEQIMQFGRHVIGQQFSPMAMSGAQRVEETGGQPFEKALSYAGFGPAPAYADRSAIQNHITHLFQQHVAPADRPYKDPDVETEQRVARNKVLMAVQRGDQPARQEAIREAIKVGLKPEQLGKLGRVYSDQNMFQRLPQADQIEVLERATPEEHKRYWQYVNAKTRIQWNKDHPVRAQ